MSNEDFATEIASVIEANIKNRTYPYGAPLPSERELSEKFSTNRNIIRIAIEKLIDKGLVKRFHGKGTFVMKTDIDDSSIHFKGMTELLQETGYEPSSKAVSYTHLTLPTTPYV